MHVPLTSWMRKTVKHIIRIMTGAQKKVVFFTKKLTSDYKKVVQNIFLFKICDTILEKTPRTPSIDHILA